MRHDLERLLLAQRLAGEPRVDLIGDMDADHHRFVGRNRRGLRGARAAAARIAAEKARDHAFHALQQPMPLDGQFDVVRRESSQHQQVLRMARFVPGPETTGHSLSHGILPGSLAGIP